MNDNNKNMQTQEEFSKEELDALMDESFDHIEEIRLMLSDAFFIYLDSNEIEADEDLGMMELFEKCKKYDPEFIDIEEDVLRVHQFLCDPAAANEAEADFAEKSLRIVLDFLDEVIQED